MSEVTIFVRIIVNGKRLQFFRKVVEMPRVPIVGDHLAMDEHDPDGWRVDEVLFLLHIGGVMAIINDKMDEDDLDTARAGWIGLGFTEDIH